MDSSSAMHWRTAVGAPCSATTSRSSPIRYMKRSSGESTVVGSPIPGAVFWHALSGPRSSDTQPR